MSGDLGNVLDGRRKFLDSLKKVLDSLRKVLEGPISSVMFAGRFRGVSPTIQ